ncbi:MAG: sigma-70 family RNA polymerase sigma factor [Planctomycetota bacterium]
MASDPDSRPRPEFATTRWSVVARAGEPDGAEARAALAQLCESYWYPLYAFLRRRGSDAEDARDLVQGFFAHLLAGGGLRRADPARGRFRAFLLASIQHYVAHQAEMAGALKRGGDRAVLSLDFAVAEGRFQREPATHATPERLYEAAWARETIERTMARLRRDYETRGQGELFAVLEECLAGALPGAPLARKAALLGSSEGAVKVALHRMRQRFREHLRSEIAEALSEPAEVDEEIRALFTALAADSGDPR